MKRDFLPTAKLEVLRRRAEILHQIRRFFDDRGFFEVETPLLSHDTVVDRYLNPMALSKREATGIRNDLEHRLWLQTSPEFGMKRLMAAGGEAIYQICKAFRQGESGAHHNPEFTMLEWYRGGDGMEEGMRLLGDFATAILGPSDPGTESPIATTRITYREAFLEYAGIDPFDIGVAELKEVAASSGQAFEGADDSLDRDGWLNLILAQCVEPRLGCDAPVIIHDWPASQSALARVRMSDPPVAERFELYVNGVELANGFHELLDAEELARRTSINNQNRVKDGNGLLPESSRLANAMEYGLPRCAGVALGVDRLVMLAVGAESIQDVIAFPIDRA